MLCKNCRKEAQGSFCPNCGAKLEKEEKKKKSHKLLIFILIIIIVIGIVFIFKKEENEEEVKEESMPYMVLSEYNIPKFIDGKYSDIKVKNEEDALKSIEKIKDLLNIKDVNKELKFDSKSEVEDITYYKFNQVYDNIKVYASELVVSVKDNDIISLSGNFIPNINVNVNNSLSLKEVENKLNVSSENVVNSSKVIYNSELVYLLDIVSESDAYQYIVNAKTGEVINKVSLVESVKPYQYTYKGDTITIEEYQENNETKYRFVDSDRNIFIYNGSIIGGGFSQLLTNVIKMDPISGVLVDNRIKYSIDGDTEKKVVDDAVKTMSKYEKIYDYYKNILGRNSYDNNGGKIKVYINVHKSLFGREELNNANWLSITKSMYIGNNENGEILGELDILGHEFTHGVVGETSKFAKAPKDEDKPNESATLNEAYSDIIGTCIEGTDFLVGNQVLPVRDLENPLSLEYPKEVGGEYYYPYGYLTNGRTLEEFLKDNGFEKVSEYDNGGEHHNSTVVSHSAYLMYKNGGVKSFNDLAKLWYNSLFLLSSGASFEDSALAVIKTAKNLGYSESAINKIRDAFYETKILVKKNFTLKGIVSDGKENLDNVKIEIISQENANIKYVIKSNNGSYQVNDIPSGKYKVTFSKNGYKVYSEIIDINKDSELNVKLEKDESKVNVNNKGVCKGKKYNCHVFTIYTLEGGENGLKEKKNSYPIEDGTVLADKNSLNKVFGKLITTDGTDFYMGVGEFKVKVSWYYKDTDTKFDWNKPITEDTEVEMKMFDGLLDNDFFQNLDDLFR